MNTLRVSIGQHSDKGRKAANQDFHGACVPAGPAQPAKAWPLALADGIGSSDVSHIASAAAVHALLLGLLLHVRRLERAPLGAVRAGRHQLLAVCTRPQWPPPLRCRPGPCAPSAHWSSSQPPPTCSTWATRNASTACRAGAGAAHAGPSCAAARRPQPPGPRHGLSPQLDIDYRDHSSAATPSCWPRMACTNIARLLHHPDAPGPRGRPDQAARAIVAEALHRGSPDNPTLQVVRHRRTAPARTAANCSASARPAPAAGAGPARHPGRLPDLRELHASHCSHLYLATGPDTGEQVGAQNPFHRPAERRDTP